MPIQPSETKNVNNLDDTIKHWERITLSHDSKNRFRFPAFLDIREKKESLKLIHIAFR